MFAAMASTIRLVMDISGRAGRNYICTQLIFSLSMFSGLWPNHDFCLTSTIRYSYGLNFFFFGGGQDSQCSDWEQRPLTREQIDYAAADAHCLLALFDSLLPDALHTIVTAEKATIGEEEIVASLNVTQGVGLAEILSGI
jgi:hypothetical protein